MPAEMDPDGDESNHELLHAANANQVLVSVSFPLSVHNLVAEWTGPPTPQGCALMCHHHFVYMRKDLLQVLNGTDNIPHEQPQCGSVYEENGYIIFRAQTFEPEYLVSEQFDMNTKNCPE